MTISFDDVKTVLEELAKIQPNRVAECYYSLEAAAVVEAEGSLGDDWEPMLPCCIVGNVVHVLNGVEGLKRLVEDTSVTLYNDDSGETENVELLRELGYTDEAIILLSRVQFYQDRGERWVTAVENAIASFKTGDEFDPYN